MISSLCIVASSFLTDCCRVVFLFVFSGGLRSAWGLRFPLIFLTNIWRFEVSFRFHSPRIVAALE